MFYSGPKRAQQRVNFPTTTRQIPESPQSYHGATRCCLFGLAVCLLSDYLISESSLAAAPDFCRAVNTEPKLKSNHSQDFCTIRKMYLANKKIFHKHLLHHFGEMWVLLYETKHSCCFSYFQHSQISGSLHCTL